MSDLISGTVQRLFPKDFEEFAPGKRQWWQKIDLNNLKRAEALWVALVIAIIVLPGIYYWNNFVILLTNAQTAQAQIKVQLQRRKDLLINLTTTLLDYAEHERTMYQYTIDQRQGPPRKKTALLDELNKAGLADLVKKNMAGTGIAPGMATGKIIALAEAYPELKLSENFQKMMEALITTENMLAERRMIYNEQANKYGTYAMSFPNCIYAFIFRFSPADFPFVMIDEDAEQYNRIPY
jgi:LemA protein